MTSFVLLFLCAAFAQDTPTKNPDKLDPSVGNPRAVMVNEADIYLSPDVKSQKLGRVIRGREVAIFEQSREFIKVLGSVAQTRDVTGSMLDKGVVRPTTPNGDVIIFGEAVDSENEASRRRGRKGADEDSRRLYYRVAEYFPKSPLAGEALWRSADIDWQLQKAGISGRKSYREQEPSLRPRMDEDLMHEVGKKFPGTKWADEAAFDLLDTKLCGDWRALAKCPEKETEIYEEYVKKHPQSPKAAEALYEAASRQAALIEIYKSNNEPGKSPGAKSKALGLLQQIITQYAQLPGDWTARAERLKFYLEQGIPTYGAGSTSENGPQDTK